MRKSWFLPLVVCVLFSIVQTSFAQRQAPTRSDLIAMSGDPDTFGANMKFAGLVSSGYVLLDPACVFLPGELGPDDRCVVLNPGAALTTFDVRDIGRITLPANSTKDVLFQMVTVVRDYQFFNTTGVAQSSAIMNFNPYISIESEALKDPRAVNPDTGVPLNGIFDEAGGLATGVDRSLAVNERIRDHANYSRTSINGLSKTYWRAWGWPEDLIQKLLQGQMTIRLHLKGKARLVSDGFFQVSVRIFGD